VPGTKTHYAPHRLNETNVLRTVAQSFCFMAFCWK